MQAFHFLRRSFGNFSGQNVNDDTTDGPRNFFFIYFHQRLGRFFPVFTYSTILFTMIVISVISPFQENQRKTTEITDASAISTINETAIFPVSPVGTKPGAPVANWVMPAMLSILLFCSIITAGRLILGFLSNRRLRGTSSTSQARLVHLLSQLSQLEGGGSQNITSRLRLAMMNRDFNGDDYEMLQQLDEDNIGHGRAWRGVSDVAISRLPVHVFKSDDEGLEDFPSPSPIHADKGVHSHCPICLEPYRRGDRITTVLCLHQYHKSCIDHWLKNSSTCPVCKSPAAE